MSKPSRPRIVHLLLPGKMDAACGAEYFAQGSTVLALVSCGKCKAKAQEAKS